MTIALKPQPALPESVTTSLPCLFEKKKQIAKRFKRSTRSINQWRVEGILPFIHIGGTVLFDVDRCIEAMKKRFPDEIDTDFDGRIPYIPAVTTYADTRQLAGVFGVSKRTISTWKDVGFLPYSKIKGVVRFDVGQCLETVRNRFSRYQETQPRPGSRPRGRPAWKQAAIADARAARAARGKRAVAA